MDTLTHRMALPEITRVKTSALQGYSLARLRRLAGLDPTTREAEEDLCWIQREIQNRLTSFDPVPIL